MRYLLFIIGSSLLLSACVSRTDYNAVQTERDEYRRQQQSSDSLTASLRQRYGEDSSSSQEDPTIGQFRRMDRLTAANLRLQEANELLVRKSELLLKQQTDLLPAGSEELQRSLIERQTALEVSAEAIELREQEITRRERSLSTQLRGSGKRDVSDSPATTMATQVAADLQQLLQSAMGTGYSVINSVDGQAVIALDNNLIYADDESISTDGEALIRKMATMLCEYRGAAYTIVAHAGGAEGNADAAYRVSSRRSVNLAIQLARFGLDPGTIVAGAQGYYGKERQQTLLRIDYRELP